MAKTLKADLRIEHWRGDELIGYYYVKNGDVQMSDDEKNWSVKFPEEVNTLDGDSITVKGLIQFPTGSIRIKVGV